MLGFLKTTDRATGKSLIYYPWTKRIYKQYDVTANITNSDKVNLTIELEGLSDNNIPVKLNLNIDIHDDGQGVRFLEKFELYPQEAFTFKVPLPKELDNKLKGKKIF